MGSGVPVGAFSFRRIKGQNFGGTVAGNGSAEIADFAVDFDGAGSASQTGADLLRKVNSRGAGSHLQYGAVLQCNVSHFNHSFHGGAESAKPRFPDQSLLRRGENENKKSPA